MSNKSFLSFLMLSAIALGKTGTPKRISVRLIDLGKVQAIYMIPGLATLVEIPGPVTGVRTGSPTDLQIIKPETPDNEVTVTLKSSNAKPTNLIIRSGKRKYIFDIVPSATIHQDSVEVVGAFGSPAFEGEEPVLIDSSESKASKNEGMK